MKRKSRDDFPASVIKKLSERVGTVCSKPDCRVPTKGPHSDPDLVMNLGVASHIHAAAPGGARYDPNQTQAQRRSAANGIWLCRPHGTEVDADEARFPAAELRRWKAETEQYMREQVSGRKARSPGLSPPR